LGEALGAGKQSFNKPALTHEQQVNHLKQRGMLFEDHDLALHYLSHLNYYRLGAYWLPFEVDHQTHKFKPDTSFENVLNLYVFDRELRLLVMDAVERVEVSIRTQLAYHLSNKYGPHAHLNPELFCDVLAYSKFIQNIDTAVKNSREDFVQHLRSKYIESLPPIWAIVELMSLGQLSKWFKTLGKPSDRKAIAIVFGMDEIILISFLHHLTFVRNICAHHSRLWNRKLTFKFKLPAKRPDSVAESINGRTNGKLYNTLAMLTWMMNQTSPGHSWTRRLVALIDKHDIDTAAMGFPEDYQKLPIWKIAD